MNTRREETWDEMLAAMRKRPAMYVGNTEQRGLEILLHELLDNRVEGAVAGRASHVELLVHGDGSLSVVDDGPSIAAEDSDDALAAAFTTAMDRSIPRLARGLSWAGPVLVNALSEWLEVSVPGEIGGRTMRFERGKPVGQARLISSPAAGIRTHVRFRIDPEIFGRYMLSNAYLRGRARQLSYLVPGVRFSVREESPDVREEYLSRRGVAEYLEVLTLGREPLHAPVAIEFQEAGMHFATAFPVLCSDRGLIASFANHCPTRDGGTHEQALHEGLVLGLNDVLHQERADGHRRMSQRNLKGRVTAVISIRVPHVEWEGSTRSRLGNQDVRKPLAAAVRTAVVEAAHRNPPEWKWVHYWSPS